jgi:hypothetical protein
MPATSLASFPFYIVIAAHGDAARLDRTFRSLATCRLPPGYRYLLLVENGPKCGIEAVSANAPTALRVRYLYNPLPSKSMALNLALTRIDEPDAFVFFTDDDASFHIDVLETYAQAAGLGPGHYFGGPVEARWEKAPPAWLMPCLPNSAKGWRLQPHETLYAFMGINWGAFLADLKVAGAFDPRFGPGSLHGATGQETEMQARLFRSKRQPVYIESAIVSHEVPRSRCNFYWALRRNYRTAMSSGLVETPLDPSRSSAQQSLEGEFTRVISLIKQEGMMPPMARVFSRQTSNLLGLLKNPVGTFAKLFCAIARSLGRCRGKKIRKMGL